MYRTISRVFAIALLFLSWNTVFPLGNPFPSAGISSASSDQDVQLRELLEDLGTKNGITFTIEEALLKGGAMDRIRSFRHRLPPAGTDLKALLDDLSRSVPNFTWQNDPNNPKIIHIVDGHLLRRPGYALGRVIDDIDFSGTVIELVDAIASKSIPVSAGGPASTDDVASMDGVTRVQIKGKSLKVRDALSDFVPLEGRRGHILWFAITYVDGSDQTTYVRFQGAPPTTPAPKE
jgi:hypothetical protein